MDTTNYEVKWCKDLVTGRIQFTKKRHFETTEQAADAYAVLAYQHAVLMQKSIIIRGIGWFKTVVILAMALYMIFG